MWKCVHKCLFFSWVVQLQFFNGWWSFINQTTHITISEHLIMLLFQSHTDK